MSILDKSNVPKLNNLLSSISSGSIEELYDSNDKYTNIPTNKEEIKQISQLLFNVFLISGNKVVFGKLIFLNIQGINIDKNKLTTAAITAITIYSIYISLIRKKKLDYNLNSSFIGAWSEPNISVKIKLFLIYSIYFLFIKK